MTIKRIDIFNIDVGKIEKFLKELPVEEQKLIIKNADNAAVGKLKAFSTILLDYGNPINWHLHPLTGKEVDKNLKWYRIPDFDNQRGDIKVIWEASRFLHFYLFARAYLLTKDKKYYQAFSRQLELWLKDNKYSYGVNFKCGQECSLRMINTLVVYSVFKSFNLVNKRDEANIKTLVKYCYKKIRSNFFYAKHMKNNHTFSEICGWIIGAWCSEDDKSLRYGYKLLEKEIMKQFFPDGGYIQYSLNYQRFTLQIMECILKIGEATKYKLSKEALRRIKESALQLYQIQDDISKDVPNYGSNDGALIFPVTACDYRDFTPVINTIYMLTTGERLYANGIYDEEILWFGSGNDKYPIRKIDKVSLAFKDSGLYTLRRNNGFLMICCQKYKFRPYHMDGMHIDLWHRGRNIFCDCGTYTYASELGKELAKTSAHNTVKLKDIEQMESYGNFAIYKWTICRNIRHTRDTFSGTMISQNGYKHTRSIEKTQHGYKVFDEVIGGSNNQKCEFNFHTPYDVRVTQAGFEILDKDKLLCIVYTKGVVNVAKSYRSLYYLRKEQINRVSVVSRMIDGKCVMEFDIKLIE